MTNGTHVRAETVDLAVRDAMALGCTATQILTHAPNKYTRAGELSTPTIDYVRAVTGAGLSLHTHASFFCVLTNDPKETKSALARKSLIAEGKDMSQLGGQCITTHPGRMKDASDVANCVENTKRVAEELYIRSPHAILCLENAVHGLHASLPQLADIIRQVDMPNVGITFDTAHAFAAGIDVLNPMDMMLQLTADVVPLVKLVHFNNSRYALGSKRDGHSLLRDGSMAMEEVEQMYKALRTTLPSTPFVIESTDDPTEVGALHQWQTTSQQSAVVQAADTTTT